MSTYTTEQMRAEADLLPDASSWEPAKMLRFAADRIEALEWEAAGMREVIDADPWDKALYNAQRGRIDAEAERDRLREAARAARDLLRSYAEEHFRKKAYDKAQRNKDMADRLDAALHPTPTREGGG